MKRAHARALRKTIAAVEILGGAMGAVLFLRHAVYATRAHPEVWLQAPLPVAVFTFCAVAGVLLWRYKPAGDVLTLVALALQVLSVRTATFGYALSCGIGLRILIGHRRLSWFAFWGSELHITHVEGATHAIFGVNGVALMFAVLLWLARRTRDAGPASAAPL